MRTRGQGHCLTFDQDSQSITISNIFSKATGLIVTKFQIEPPLAEGREVCSNSPGHITSMATMPIHGKNHCRSSSLEPVDQLP